MSEKLQFFVDRYLDSDEFCNCIDDLEIFDGLELNESISISALSEFNGKRHPHQRRLSKYVLEEAERRLKGRCEKIGASASFDDLHHVVLETFGKVQGDWKNLKGAGPLYTYDVSHRIGRSLGLQPEYVYLHAGALKGARHLGVKGKKVPLTAFPSSLHCFTPAQVEDFLCRCKDQLSATRT